MVLSLFALPVHAADAPKDATAVTSTAGALLGKPSNAGPSSAKAAAAPAKDTPPKSEETVLYTVRAGDHSVLARTDALGRCKGYLGREGAGWLPYPDPKINGDDLAAATSADGKWLALISSRGGAANLFDHTELGERRPHS